MAVSDILYDNWGNITVLDRYYDMLPVKYLMTTTAGEIEIKEPIGWNTIPFVHKRDKDMHGFNYEFTGLDFELKFDCDSGMDAILAEYALNGNDGEVLFKRVLTYNGDDIVEYEGRLNLNVLKRASYTLECSVERKSLHQLINSRLSTKINMNSDTDLDDNSVPVYAFGFLTLPGQTLSEKYESLQNIIKEEPFTETRTGDSLAYVFFDFNDPSVNTINGFIGSNLGISGDDNGITNGNHDLFKFQAAGSYEVDVTVDFQINLRIHPRILGFGKKVSQAWIFLQIIINKADGSPQQRFTIGSIPEFNPGVQGFLYPRLTGTGVFDIEVEEGDAMLIVATVKYGHNANKLKSVEITVKEFKAQLKIQGFSQATASFAEGRLIKPCMDAMLLRMTGQEDVVKSEFYSLASEDQPADGCGANRMLLNGGAIRLAPTNKFPLTTTFKDMLTSLNAIDCIGMGYEWDQENSSETIRIEPVDYFYRDEEVIELTEVFEYKEETAKDLIYNKLVVGYNKYKEEEENSLDEVHATHEYQTPIKTESNEYNILSKYNASGYLIETTRRAQFAESEDQATSYDDDIFIVHVQGDGGGVFYEPVTDEPFDDVSGIISPTTTVNLTLTPKRMLMAHAKWLASSLVYKNGSQLIRNTFTKQNKTLSTTLKSDYCPRGDDAKLPLVADADIILSVFGDGTGVYSPEWVYFKARLNMSQVRYIMNAHRGLSPDGNNYGYITFTNDNGEVCKGWLHELTYSRDSEEVSFKLLKKKFP